MSENKKEESNKKAKFILKLIVIFILAFLIIFATINVVTYLYNKKYTTPDETTTTISTTQTTETSGGIKNPINFKKLQKGNDEIYAYIKIKDTKVDYPICQSKTDDEFYLRHRASDKSWSESGAIYTESVNSENFDDLITVIYGHNGYSDTFFTTLHYFEDKDFFDSHEYFYIYTPTRRLTYQIFSAFKYDDRHIINSLDFSDHPALLDYEDFLLNPDSTLKNTRKNLDTNIDLSSNIVILSTCITNQRSNRFLVCGVLVKDEQTN